MCRPDEQPEQVGRERRVLGGEHLDGGQCLHQHRHVLELLADRRRAARARSSRRARRTRRRPASSGSGKPSGSIERARSRGLDGRVVRFAEVLGDAREQVPRVRVLRVHRQRPLDVRARLGEAHEVVLRGRAQVEEVRGVGRTLGAPQRLERGASVRPPRGRAWRRAPAGPAGPGGGGASPSMRAARLLDLALVEQVVDALHLHPVRLGQRLVGFHERASVTRGASRSSKRPARAVPPVPGGSYRPRPMRAGRAGRPAPPADLQTWLARADPMLARGASTELSRPCLDPRASGSLDYAASYRPRPRRGHLFHGDASSHEVTSPFVFSPP